MNIRYIALYIYEISILTLYKILCSSHLSLIKFRESAPILIWFKERVKKEHRELWFFEFVNYFIVIIYWLKNFIEFNIINIPTGTFSMN